MTTLPELPLEQEQVITLTSLMKPNKTAVVTGASSGIGKAASLAFALAGMNVWMIDIDQHDLGASQKLVKSRAAACPNHTDGQIIVAEVLDVTNAHLMKLLAEQVFEATGNCTILLNNAGIGATAGSITEQFDLTVMDRIFKVNTYGVVYGCQAFLPKMMAMESAAMIINTGSKQGITCPPGNEAYNMSKAALKVYTEGLEHELRLLRHAKKCRIRAALLIPGWVHTRIQCPRKWKMPADDDDGEPVPPLEQKASDSPSPPPAGAWLPEQVIDFMITEIDAGRFYIVCPDNEVGRDLDNARMTWAMQDVTENRPPRSRWHPDHAASFQVFLNDK